MTMKFNLQVLILSFICLHQFASSAPSLQCYQDIAAYVMGITPLNPKLWALKMLDSSAKFPADGIFQGTFLMQMGQYDQCLATKGPAGDNGLPRFTGKYCKVQLGFKAKENSTDARTELILAQMKIAYELQHQATLIPGVANHLIDSQNDPKKDIYIPGKWGVCAPSSCNADGVKMIADLNIGQFFSALNLDVSTKVAEPSCRYDGDGSKDLDVGAWIFVIFTLVLTFALITTTVVDYLWPKDKGLNVIIKAFSMRTNLTELFALPKSAYPGQLTCLNGIRVISTWWVILLHCYVINTFVPNWNAATSLDSVPHQWSFAPMLSGALSVDTFFFLGGLLTVYVPLRDQKRGGSFNILKYYIYRYLRITCPVAMAIFYVSTVHKLTGEGPLWNAYVGIQAERCEKNWWVTLVYIANYYQPNETNCMGQVWYLMCDMQLALLAPMVIIPMLKWPKIGIILTSVLAVGSTAAAFAFTYIHKLPWTNIFPPPSVQVSQDFMLLIYTNTIVRATPYLFGMLLAYILVNKITFKMPTSWLVIEWLLNTALCLTLIYVIVIPYSRDYVYEELGAAFFAAFHRIGWSIGLGWIIWACVNGYAGPVNEILSWKYFLPLSKLSFCAYLVHMDLILYHAAVLRTYTNFSHYDMAYEFFGTLIMMVPLTLFLYLAVDAPTQTLMRELFKKPRKADDMKVKEGKGHETQEDEGIIPKNLVEIKTNSQ